MVFFGCSSTQLSSFLTLNNHCSSSPEVSILSLKPSFSKSSVIPVCHATNRFRSQSASPSTSSGYDGSSKMRRKKKKRITPNDVEIVRDRDEVYEGDEYDILPYGNDEISLGNNSGEYSMNAAMPKPPAGFVVDDTGNVVLVSDKRVATIVDSSTNRSLECVVRRTFKSSKGDECMLLYPLDMPVLMLKSTNVNGWSALNDDEVEELFPAAAYALAKIHMHLVRSGFCYTARGGFCYSEEDIFDFQTDDEKGIDGLPSEGVEVACFQLDGAHYMIYTPSDPLLFVTFKDANGMLQIADDDLLDDPAIIDVIDEETEFNALVEEEAALLDSIVGRV